MVLRHRFITLLVTLATIATTIYLYIVIPKGFFPQQDTGRMMGNVRADQDTSFQQMNRLLVRYASTISADENVDGVVAFVGGGSSNTARMFVTLKPWGQRKLTVDEVNAKLRRQLAQIPGAQCVLVPVQDLRFTARGGGGGAQYSYTLQGDNLEEISTWAAKMQNAIRKT